MVPCAPPADATLTVLLIDDIPSQSERIQRCLRPYRIGVEWCPSYRAAMERLQDADLGQLVDLILIDQAFDVDSVVPEDLLTASEVGTPSGSEDWDVRLHQGLFIMARLGQDMRAGLIPFIPMMILTDYAKVELASQALGLGGYESKRRLITDPYAAIRRWLPQMRPRPEDVTARLTPVVGALGIGEELAAEVGAAVVGELDPDEVCAALEGLADANDWAQVGRALDQLRDRRRRFSVERLARALEAAWQTSSQGWLRVCDVTSIGSLGHGFEAFRVHMVDGRRTFPALVAARAFHVDAAPAVRQLQRGFRRLREIDPRQHPIRLARDGWTILASWLPEPEGPVAGAFAAARRLAGVTARVRDLHRRGLAHGSLTVLTAGFEDPVFGGIRGLGGEQDFAVLRRDDLRALPALAVATFGEEPPDDAREALERWSALVAQGDLEGGAGALEGARLREEPARYFNFDSVYSGGEGRFRDLLLANLGADDAVLREVPSEGISPLRVDFVVCVGGTLAVLEHRAVPGRVVVRDGEIASVSTNRPGPETARWRRTVARCREASDVLARRIEAGLALPAGSIFQLPAIVAGGAAVEPPPDGTWRPVLTEAEAIAELTRLSQANGSPRGVDMARFLVLPEAQPEVHRVRFRGLHWSAVPVGPGLLRMRTWRKQWRPESWRTLLRRLAVARAALERSGLRQRPFPLEGLRAYDDGAEPADVDGEAGLVEWVEYDVRIPGDAAPLASYFHDPASDAARRSLAAHVLRSVVAWERSGLGYRTMGPNTVLQAGGRIHFDRLDLVVPLDPVIRWRQRRGAAACLVFLLAPWPYGWPTVLTGTVPPAPEQHDERSAWGIGAAAIAALLDPNRELAQLSPELDEKADLLAAAARLDRRFPAWPWAVSQEVGWR